MENMETKDIVTMVGIILVFIVGLINIALSIHRTSLDGITKNRMDWIKEVRDVASNILIGYENSTLNRDIFKLRLLLNCTNQLDREIIFQCTALGEKVILIKELENKSDWDSIKKEQVFLDNLIEDTTLQLQIYLKMEWTRVKCESSVFKIRFLSYWDPINGFKEEKAIKKITKKYNEGFSISKLLSKIMSFFQVRN